MKKQDFDTKGHEIKRKRKGGLANGITLGAVTTMAAVTVGTATVSADEVTLTASEPQTELVASTETAVAEPVIAPAVEEVAVSTPAPLEAVEVVAPIEPAAEVVAPVEVVEPVVETVAPAVEEVPVVTEAVSEDLPADVAVITNPETDYQATTEGNTVTVKSDELNKAIQEATQAGVIVSQEEGVVSVGTASSKEEADALAREIVTKQNEDVKRIKDKQEDLEQAKADAEAKAGQDSYLSQVVVQNLTFNSEPNATVSITGADYFATDNTVGKDTQGSFTMFIEDYKGATSATQPQSTIDWVASDNLPAYATVLSPGKTMTATYTNLTNSSYDNAAISKVVYSIENKSNKQATIYVMADPTNGIAPYVQDEIQKIGLGIQVFDKNGKVIAYSKDKPAILGLSSLNHETDTNRPGWKHQESITDYNFTFVPITGSSITENANGIHSVNDNGQVQNGSKYSNNDWDQADNPLFYYGAGAGVVTSGDTIRFTMVRENNSSSGQWLTISSKVAASGIITNPKANYTLYSYDTVGSVILDNLIEGTDTKLTGTEIIKAAGTATGTDYSTTYKPTITTADGRNFTYVSSTKNTTGKVLLGETRVVNYYVEIKRGDVTVEYKDEKGTPLLPPVTDTPTTEVGKDYDTTEHRKSTIVTNDGKTYDFVKTDGKEVGKVVEGNTNIVHTYKEVKGTVLVNYQDTLGNKIKEQVVDTPESSTGTAYDTTDNRPQEIKAANGATYRINTGYTKGNETGKVVRGETIITYIYEEVKGDVLVKYQDRKGGTILADVVDTPTTSTGTNYDTTDHRPQVIELADGATFRLIPNLTKGAEKGKVVEGTTTIIYVYDEIKGDVVVDYRNKANEKEEVSPRVTDTPTTSTGTAYDTTDNKPVTIITPDGRTFRIDPNVTKGIEVGKVIEGRTIVTYLYDELQGNVIVHYKDEAGNTIRQDVFDLKDSSTNRDYDTTDNKPVTIVTDQGRTYDIVLNKTKGNETGKTVVGNIDVTYVYKEVFGDVVVHYENEAGDIIHPEAFDTKQSPTGKTYDTTDLKHAAIFHDGSVYNIIVTKTKGNETGKVARGTTHVTYVYKVEEPVSKKVVNNEEGQNVEGKTMLPGDLLVNRILIDNDQNKGLVGLTDADKEVGLFVVENYPEKYTEPVLEAVRVVLAGTDKVVDLKTETVLYNSISETPQAIQDQLKAMGYDLKEGDRFALTTSVDKKAYTENYALKGIQLELIFPTRVLKAGEASDFENIALVGDFNGVAVTNVVSNRVPNIDPKKDVFKNLSDGMKKLNSIDGQTVNIGDVVTFEFAGSYIPGDRGTILTSYGHDDTLSKLLRYDGNFKYISNARTVLTNGSVIELGEDVTRYFKQLIVHNEDGTTTVRYRMTDEFIKLIGNKDAFQFNNYVQATVIGEGLIENYQDEIINDTVYKSNKVTLVVKPDPKPTPTPKPNPVPTPTPTPTPSPEVPTPVVPAAPATPAQPTLPNTGEEHSVLATTGLALIASTLGLAYVGKRKKA